VNIPSYLVRTGDVIVPREKSKKLVAIEENISKIEHRGLPGWIEMDTNNLTGKVLNYPSRDDIELPVQEQLIIELYSK
jgi:small subunit ribosomal protein S4